MAKITEKEYIEREAIEKAFAEEISTNYLDDYAKGFQAALLAVMSIPAAKAAPVRHGRWIDNKHTDTAICSECKGVFTDETNYCSKCGAKMDKTE